ncbi:hypothetical protein F5Y11DRAFT_321548 [Daldinia sp. FL1419]|nr:hypothetical protein F5Y11DRAFT_321548 [Daldinia sp. FL1419]
MNLAHAVFSKSSADCTASWKGYSYSAFPQGSVYNCTLIEPNGAASWQVQLLQEISGKKTVDLVFTLTQYVNAIGGYWKVIIGTAHFEEGVNLDVECDDKNCVSILKEESGPFLVNTTTIVCKGTCS